MDKEIKIPYILISCMGQTIEFLVRQNFILIIFILSLIMFWVDDKFGNRLVDLDGLDQLNGLDQPENAVRLVWLDDLDRPAWPH